MTPARRARGVALITAVLIAALAGSVASRLAWDNALEIRRTTVTLYRDQAIEIAFGAESWLEQILAQDFEDSDADHLGEVWAADLPGLPIEGVENGEVFGKVEDLQGRFNINNLIGPDGKVDQAALQQFQRLLVALGLDLRFAAIAADWLDSDQNPSFPDGAEDSIYTGFVPPYRTADQILSSASELAALQGMDKKSLDALLPYVTALPKHTKINVNTASGPVLQSLDQNLTADDVEQLMSERAESGFADFKNTFSPLVAKDVLDELDVSTQFFQLKLVVRIDNVRITYYSLLERSPNSGDVVPMLRSLGTT
jgi:general secretion pathway protein K